MEEDNIEIKKRIKKKRRFNFLDIITITVIVLLIAIYMPRAYNLYSERKELLKESKKEKVVEYPLEVEITEQDTKYFARFFEEYAVGITSNVNFLDGITQNEMVDFSRAILSEKYSSSGVISETSINNTVKRFFGISDIDYKSLGYKSLDVYKDYEVKKVFNITKLMKLDKDSDLYLAYIDCIDKSKVQDGSYKKEDIEKVYIFTFKKVEEKDENGNVTNLQYILQKVEEENTQEENVEKK